VLIEQIFGQPSLLMPLTNLASAAIVRTRVDSTDAIILDQQAHMSVKMACEAAKLNGTHMVTIPHNRMDTLERRIIHLTPKHDKIWYMADGIYSMFGDVAPIKELYALMDKYPNFRVLIDDAHGVSWSGKYGAGMVDATMGYFHSQLYMVTSLSKAFGGQGAVAVFPTERERDIVKKTSPQHIFFSPLGNAALGANIESAKIHLSEEFPKMQGELKARIELFKETSKALNIPLANPNCISPIFYIGTGSSELAVQFSHRLLALGFYINIASQPVVPKDHAGLRIVITRHHTEQDIKELLYVIHELMEELLPKHELLVENIAKAFEPYFA
jgi:7-keto-8-aminopelargonate synthetase-like enzyme